MLKPIRTTHPIIKIINHSLIDLPSPSSISYMWNFGSLLGLCLGVQIITGLFLAMHYTGDVTIAFDSIVHICRDVNSGWIMRIMHANGASIFFICLYMHIGRGTYFGSYHLLFTWTTGIIILLLLMMTAFVGYVLPWGQMSFWGATVITKLLSAIPYIGSMMVQWLWGGFAVDNATLTRFFAFHFILPFVVFALVIVHLLFLHQTGSNNPLGLSMNKSKVPFHPFFSSKDALGFLWLIFSLLMISLVWPYSLGDVENFILSNPLVTPIHIQPEWYFLFAYAILRSIPDKLGGVVALIMSILIFLSLPFSMSQSFNPSGSNMLLKFMFWMLIVNIFLLTWIGARPVEDPYIFIGQFLTVSYFSIFFIKPMITKLYK